MTEPKNLTLSLKILRESYVEGESIDLEVSLINDTSVSILIEDLTIFNNPLHFQAVNNLGKEFSGSLQSSRIKDGLSFPPIRDKPMFLFEPNSEKTVNIDLLEIFGELPEGDYTVKATYVSGGIRFVRSEPIFFKVLKSAPVYSKTFQDSLRATSNTTRTAWINREEDGFYLFIMEDSQYYPSNLRSNRRILKIDEIQRAYPSMLGSPDQDAEHLIWSQAGTARVATLQQRVLRDVKAVRLKVLNFQILEPPFTTKDGKLYFVVTSKEGEQTIFKLVSYSLEGKAEIEEICRFSGGFAKYCIIYDVEPRLHVAWASDSGEIYCTSYGLEKPISAKGEPRMLTKGKAPILDVQISKACETYTENLELRLLFADYETPNEFHSHLINAESGENLSHSFFPLPEQKSLVLMQSVLDLQCRPHYLFQDNAGVLWFKALESAELEKVTGESETYPGNVDCPVLLASSNMSRNYGIYLRYIKDMSRFVYKKLESLT